MRKTLSVLASLVATILPGSAAGAECREVASTSGNSIFDVFVREPGVAWRGDVAYGALPRQRLDVFTPCAAPNGPIVLFFYGGAWTSGDRETYEFVGTALASRGLTTVVADYRLHPEVRYPAFVDDAARAYAWVDRELARRGGRRRPVFLMGHSAGAHIAALLAVDRRRLAEGAPHAARPAGLIGLAGPYAFDPTTWKTTRAIFETALDAPDKGRPVALVGRHRPIPSLLLTGADDRTVAAFNATDFAAALAAAGGSVRRIDYSGIGHVGLISSFARPLRWRAAVLDDVVDFVERTTGADARREAGAATGSGG